MSVSLIVPCRASLQAQPSVSVEASPAASTPFTPEPPVRSYVAIAA